MRRGIYKGATDKQMSDLRSFQYKRMLEERRGHNYEYWTEKHDKLIDDDIYQLYQFERNNELIKFRLAIQSEETAKKVVEQLRAEGNFARIVCGYEKDRQGTKYFSVIYRPKNIKKK